MSEGRLKKLAWSVLAYNVLVILFGALVRATGSGAGCGSDWPTCRGGLVPLSGTAETAIEFTHRFTSGIALIAVFTLLVMVRRARPAGDLARKTAAAAAAFIVVEALIGAALVLFGWVEDDQSTGRAISISLHLVNTLFLLASLTLTAWWLGDGSRPARPLFKGHRLLLTAGVGLMLVGATGAITALGDTLFPAESIFEGIRDDFTGAFLVRLRWIHPLIAVATGLLIAWLIPRYVRHGGRATRFGGWLMWIVIAQIVLGVVNVLLLAPVWMQIVHLLVADVMWIVFVLWVTESLAASQRADALVAA